MLTAVSFGQKGGIGEQITHLLTEITENGAIDHLVCMATEAGLMTGSVWIVLADLDMPLGFASLTGAVLLY